MDPIKLSIRNPIAVFACLAMVIIFGLMAFTRIPIQLAPDLNRPVLTINTSWPGAAPEEVEREIITRQEQELKGLENLQMLTSEARPNSGRITLEFALGTDMNRALLLTANQLDRVNSYPDEAKQPSFSVSSSQDNPIAWFRVKSLDDNPRSITEYGQFADDVIKERFQRINGVGSVNRFGGSERQVQIVVDPFLLARFQLGIPDVVQALRQADFAATLGDVDEGKRSYVVRIDHEFDEIERIENVVLRSLGRVDATGSLQGKAQLRIGDIASVTFGYSEPTARIRSNGYEAITLNITREAGANVIRTMAEIRDGVASLNQGPLATAQLALEQVYDETIYIDSAIELVTRNIQIGGLLAITVMLIFLRSWLATLVIAIAIPVSVIGTFVAMEALGRSLNVISLAGIAFAVGMVVDAAIVVLENIYRLRIQGMDAARAAWLGTREVWGAVMVATLTTIAVFIPILIMDLEIGQLFRDIAVAISVSVILSLVVACTVIPTLCSLLLSGGQVVRIGRTGRIDQLAGQFADAIQNLARRMHTRPALALILFLAIAASCATAAWRFLPKLEYLPDGNRNFVFGILFPPPGYNLDAMQSIADQFEQALQPRLADQVQKPQTSDADQPVVIRNFFFVNTASSAFIGASADEAHRAGELIPDLRALLRNEPGIFGFFRQPSLFGRGVGGTRSLDLDISGPVLEDVAFAAQTIFQQIAMILPLSEGNQIRPRPALELGEPELRITPDLQALFDNNLSLEAFGQSIDAFNDGVLVKEIQTGGERIDLVVKGSGTAINATQAVGTIPIVTQDGNVLSADQLSRLDVTVGPSTIRRVEGQRTITLQVNPRDGIALEEALDLLTDELIEPMRAELAAKGISLTLTGTASKLAQTWGEMQFDLLIALMIVYLVMASLFSSFLYPLVVIVSVPIAATGGILGLALLNRWYFNPLDMLT
ncbi:MAG: efflux RND transporter permease subunit, partial [Pseudomonadota bacterium]